MSDSMLDAVNLMVEESGKPIKAIAEEIGKPYSTLKRELNEFDEGAKLGAELLLPLMLACSGDQPLQYLADRRGYNLIRRKSRAGLDGVTEFQPVALFLAASRLLELCQDGQADRLEVTQAVDAVIEEAEAVLSRRFPAHAAFRRHGLLRCLLERVCSRQRG